MNLIERAKNIILKPKDEWAVVSQETTTPMQILTTYLIPLALIPAIAYFIAYGVIGVSMPFIGKFTSMSWGIKYAIIQFVSTVAGAYIAAFVIDALAPSFGSTKNFGRALQLVVYSYTPQMIAGILYLFPSTLGLLVWIAGIYGLVIMYKGLTPMMMTPPDKVTGYFIVSIIVMIAVYFILGLILGAIFLASAVTSMTP